MQDAGRVRMVNAQAGVVAPDGYTQKIGADLVTDIDDEDEQEQLIATLKAERKLKGKFRAS